MQNKTLSLTLEIKRIKMEHYGRPYSRKLDKLAMDTVPERLKWHDPPQEALV